MIQYLYLLDYKVPVEEAQGQDGPSLLFHAKVYTMAVKYLIQGLQDLAVVKFKTAATMEVWGTQDFLSATKEAYNATPDTARGLRQVVLETFADHKDLLNKEETKVVMKATNDLAFDTLYFFFGRSPYSF
ncbi:uncharacterized protein B0I36DRAFT_337159 [Microdochium trichocladiopsis]|uniref:Uncharacterized protein n=1 Tax=Microdochium trichocladiopsis TaxID=1682393 RepID=A0A9P9BJ18_9PEZI|nr:uncharacterized protein B0I36DRAFT_337159 [Microdochium trichocladiopsis]KAH7016268.1 hypothetical protein B0I36DRAFT_337159 [Microdochium trichocladiopsis]